MAELRNSALFVQRHWISQHNINVSGNPSQETISSRQPVIYAKCLNELKRVSPGLKLLVLADSCLHCFLLVNEICLSYTGLEISLTFMLFTWRQSKIRNLNREADPVTTPLHHCFTSISWHNDFIFICDPHCGCFSYFIYSYLALAASTLLFGKILTSQQSYLVDFGSHVSQTGRSLQFP